MIRGILFDLGGTLDSDGVHWLERFIAVYRANGVTLPRDAIRAAFDAAERRAAADPAIADAPFAAMVAQHVAWQAEQLGIGDAARQRAVADAFIAPVRAIAVANAALLAELAACGFRLGVVSNGCGNVDVLCREFGYARSLAAIVDSRRAGVAKPDPAIFRHAAGLLALGPAEVLMVGDSFERDIEPARRVGMRTAWLEGPEPRDCPDPAAVDLRLRALADLRDAPLVMTSADALRRATAAAQAR